MQKQQPVPDLSQTTPFLSKDGNGVFQMGFLLRKMSKFLTGNSQDTLIPVQIFYDVKTGEPIKDTIPKELWSEFGFEEDKPEPIKPNLKVI